MTRHQAGSIVRSRAPRAGPRLAGALALVLLLLGAVPAVAADPGLPDLESVRLTPADLGAGFVNSTDSASSFFEATGALSAAFTSSPALADHNSTVLERRAGNQIEFVVMVLSGPVSAADQALFDAEIEPARAREQVFTWIGGANGTIIDTPGVGERRVGIRIVSDNGVTEEMAIFRRGPVIAFVGYAWLEGTVRSTSLGDLARRLDGRLAAVVGVTPPTFREPGLLVPELTTHIPTPLDVSTDPAVVGTNLALAALATILLTISSRLATKMLAEHEAAIARRVPAVRLVERLEARFGAALGGRVRSHRLLDLLRLAGISMFYGVVFSLLEPSWNPFSVTGAWLFVSFTIAFGVVGIADDLVQWRVARGWSLPADLAVRPTNVLLAVLSTGVSRVAAFVPGIMFGTPEALRLDTEALDDARARRLTGIGFAALLAIGGASWAVTIATTAAARSGPMPAIVGGIEALLLVMFAATIQNLFVSLLGLSGTAGGIVRRWSPIAWVAALLAITFVFWHTLVNPMGDASTAFSTRNVQVTLGIVGGFTAVTVAVWVVLLLAAPRGARPVPVTTPEPAAGRPEPQPVIAAAAAAARAAGPRDRRGRTATGTRRPLRHGPGSPAPWPPPSRSRSAPRTRRRGVGRGSASAAAG